MGFRIHNTGDKILIEDTSNHNITYYDKANLAVSASSGSVIITNTIGESINTIFNQVPANIDLPSFNGLYDLVTTIHGYIASSSGDAFSGGWADYNDTATTGSPIAVTASPTALTNNGLGIYTNTSYLPISGNGITQLWDTSLSGFDFTALDVGDMLDIRMDISVIIASTNTVVDVDLHIGSGGGTVPFISDQNYKATGTFEVIRYMGLYIGSIDVRDTLAQLKISADKNCTCTVTGFYIKAIRRG